MSYLAYPIKILQKNQCIQYRVCFLFINNHIRNLPNLYATFLEDEDNRYLSSSSFATYKMLIQVISTVKFCLIHIIVLSVFHYRSQKWHQFTQKWSFPKTTARNAGLRHSKRKILEQGKKTILVCMERSTWSLT